jgi:hypothetical protein
MAALDGRYRAPRMPEFTYPETVVVPPLGAAPRRSETATAPASSR